MAVTLQEYASYLAQLGEGQAGKLVLLPGESPPGVRRRLALAAKAAGKRIGTRREGDALYFWVTGETAPAEAATTPAQAVTREDGAANVGDAARPPREEDSGRRARPTYINEVPRLPAPPQGPRWQQRR